MHYLWMFVVGAIARWVMAGAEHMNFMMTGILGIVGSFVGGSRLFSKNASAEGKIQPAGIIVLFIYDFIYDRLAL